MAEESASLVQWKHAEELDGEVEASAPAEAQTLTGAFLALRRAVKSAPSSWQYCQYFSTLLWKSMSNVPNV